MKKRILFAGLIALAMSCASPKPETNNVMKTEHLTYFSFDHHNTMAMFSGEKYKVNTLKDGRIHVLIDEGFPGEKEFYLDDSTILDELLAIIKTYKMDKYKEDYKSPYEVFDGDSWSLYYKYDSKRSVSSGGYMGWPDNYHDMRRALSQYFAKWRDYQKGVLLMDFFRFTSKNNRGCDIEYSLQRGENEATLTLRNAERGIDSTLKVSNDVLQEFQKLASSVQLKNTLYDYYTEEPEATRNTYFVRYNTGDTVSGITCHTQYPSHKVIAILEFFGHWLPK